MRRLLVLPLALLGLATLGLASANALVSTNQVNAGATGVISKLGSTSITVGKLHRHRLTCLLTSVSPDVGSFAVGDRVKVACVNHVLVAVAGLPGGAAKVQDRSSESESQSGTTTEPTVTAAGGPLTGLTRTTISVQTMGCTLGPSSPSTAGFSVGDVVRMYCMNGVLYALKHADSPAPSAPTPTEPTTTTTTTTTGTTTSAQTYTAISGTISALGSSISVQGGDSGTASLTCAIGAASPSTSGFAIGDLVRMYCLNGVLYSLSHSAPAATSTTTTTTTTTATSTTTTGDSGTSGEYAYRDGTLTFLSVSSITVSSGDGSLTCTINGNSPSTGGYAVGNATRMYCQSGALIYLRHL